MPKKKKNVTASCHKNGITSSKTIRKEENSKSEVFRESQEVTENAMEQESLAEKCKTFELLEGDVNEEKCLNKKLIREQELHYSSKYHGSKNIIRDQSSIVGITKPMQTTKSVTNASRSLNTLTKNNKINDNVDNKGVINCKNNNIENASIEFCDQKELNNKTNSNILMQKKVEGCKVLSERQEINCMIRVDNSLFCQECRLHPLVARKLHLCPGSIVQVRSGSATVFLELFLSSSSASRESLYLHNDIAEMLLSNEVVVSRAEPWYSFPLRYTCDSNLQEERQEELLHQYISSMRDMELATAAPLLSSLTLIVQPLASSEHNVNNNVISESSLPPSLYLELASIFRERLHHRLVFAHLCTSLRAFSHLIKFTVTNLKVNYLNIHECSHSKSSNKKTICVQQSNDEICNKQNTHVDTFLFVPYGIVSNKTCIEITFNKRDCDTSHNFSEASSGSSSNNNRSNSKIKQEEEATHCLPEQHFTPCNTITRTTTMTEETVVTVSESVIEKYQHILIMGETGTGKSYQLNRLARIAASKYQRHVIELRVEELATFAGVENGDTNTSTALEEIFQRATLCSPCTIVIDDLHLICGATSSYSSAFSTTSILSAHSSADNFLGSNHSTDKWAMKLLTEVLVSYLRYIRSNRVDVQLLVSAPSCDLLDSRLTSTVNLGKHIITLRPPETCAERCTCIAQCMRDVLPFSVVNALLLGKNDTVECYTEESQEQHEEEQEYEHETIVKKKECCRTVTQKVNEINLGKIDIPSTITSDNVKEYSLREVANRTHGFTQRDIRHLIERTMFDVFTKRGKLAFTWVELTQAATHTRPSSLRQFDVSIPEVCWDDIGGSEEAKKVLQEVVQWSLGRQQKWFAQFHLSPPKGVLLYGPPGCSKTMLAKALAHESHMNFISIKGPEIFSKWVGDSEKAVREIFTRARASAPCVVFIDELDGMCGHRGRGGVNDRVISQFLTELDGLPAAFDDRSHALVFVAATNRPDQIDAAVLRPGRIDRKLHIGLPQEEERVSIARIHLRRLPVELGLTESYIATRTEGYTGAEVVAVIKEAAFHAITQNIKAQCITYEDVEAALRKIRPRIDKQTIEWYKHWPNVTSQTKRSTLS